VLRYKKMVKKTSFVEGGHSINNSLYNLSPKRRLKKAMSKIPNMLVKPPPMPYKAPTMSALKEATAKNVHFWTVRIQGQNIEEAVIS